MPFERHVVISGAGKGIGREMALHLAGTGRYVLHLVSRTATTLDATVADCLAAGAKVHRYVADLTSAEAVNGIHWDFQESIPIALVNNAGGYLGKSLESTTPEELQQQVNQNLFAAFHLTNALLDNLEKSRRRAGAHHRIDRRCGRVEAGRRLCGIQACIAGLVGQSGGRNSRLKASRCLS